MTPRKPQGAIIGIAREQRGLNGIVTLTRRPRSKWWHLTCFGSKRHYRKDGSCVHTDEAIARLNPEVVPVQRVRVVDGREATEGEQ